MAGRRSTRETGRGRAPGKRLLAALAVIVVAAIVGSGLFAFATGWSLPGAGETPPISRWATVSTDVLNVRENPTTEAPILGSVNQGAPIQVVGEVEAGFAPVQFEGSRGWMAVAYLAFDDDTAPRSLPTVQIPEVSAAEQPERWAPDVPVVVEPVLVKEPVEHWIDVNRTTATVTLFAGDTAIASFAGKIGRDPSSDGFYATAIGTFHVYSMNKGLAPTPFADDTWLSDWVGFDPERKNGIHSPVRDEFGNEKPWQNPATLGCVRLDAAAAVTVFEFAEIGMRVEVHD